MKWSGDDTPLSYDERLMLPFSLGIKTREEFLIGAEFEYFPVDRETLSILPFTGKQATIAHLLEALAAEHQWTIIREREHPIALKRQGEQITLEPSGVIEYVTPPLQDVSAIQAQQQRFLRELMPILEKWNAALLLRGYHPYETLESTQLVPKERYAFMYDRMQQTGTKGREMMKLTASIQVAVDYDSEEDALRKMQLAAKATPFFLALTANSSIRQGAFANRISLRAETWYSTDAARTAFPPFLFLPRPTFSDYAEWALDVPMYFIERDGKNIPLAPATFRDFLLGKVKLSSDIPQPFATEADWELHLSTLFPWVRLRKYVEIRAFDMNMPDRQLAAVALVQGLFYSQAGLETLEELFGGCKETYLKKLMQAVIERGLDAEAAGFAVKEVCRNLVGVAKDGLPESEKHFLSPFENRLQLWSYDDIRRKIAADTDAHIRECVLTGLPL